MSKFKVKIIDKKYIAEGTKSFYFKKPEGFEFKAGQFLDITLINPPETDAEGNTRAFSIASAPYEQYLMIATRMRDTAFKRVLDKIPFEQEVEIDGPLGSFTLHNDSSRSVVFIMGGIGITPARSIVLEASKNKLPHKLYVFYSNRRPEDAAFLDELINLEKENSNYKFIGTVTNMEKSNLKWDGETGYITKMMLEKYIPEITKSIFYLAGPSAMVGAMRKMLEDSGIDSDNIKTEEFSGY